MALMKVGAGALFTRGGGREQARRSLPRTLAALRRLAAAGGDAGPGEAGPVLLRRFGAERRGWGVRAELVERGQIAVCETK